ncbi:MAG: GNAT family N-acetyltransferase [Ilumatobacteraceae bacterium]
MDAVHYSDTADGVTADDLDGFFVGWPEPPSLARRLQIVHAADEVVIARSTDGEGAGTVIGFSTAITDHCFAAYVPLVEVLPAHQGRGIGTAMVRQLLTRLGEHCYMVDLVCDDDVVPFYERIGGTRLNAVAWRYYDRL